MENLISRLQADFRECQNNKPKWQKTMEAPFDAMFTVVIFGVLAFTFIASVSIIISVVYLLVDWMFNLI